MKGLKNPSWSFSSVVLSGPKGLNLKSRYHCCVCTCRCRYGCLQISASWMREWEWGDQLDSSPHQHEQKRPLLWAQQLWPQGGWWDLADREATVPLGRSWAHQTHGCWSWLPEGASGHATDLPPSPDSQHALSTNVSLLGGASGHVKDFQLSPYHQQAHSTRLATSRGVRPCDRHPTSFNHQHALSMNYLQGGRASDHATDL